MDLGPGQVVDRYTVVDKIGRGGMAEVYRVRHNTLGTDHALKVLSLNIPSIRERLIQEGRVQALLQHPHIVAVTDVLDVQGSPGLLMQLVKGPSLEDWLSCNRPTLPEALRIFRAILEALEEAHRLEIVHRDLKPGNVMLSTQRGVLQPKVTDFGLAKLLAEEVSPTQTRTGLPMGTPAYMSPEQITDAKSVDLRTDIFALGCILYELTCGQMAFIGANTLEVFNAVAGGDYAPPRTLVPDLPEPVVRAIHGCLQQQREMRIPSCEALAAVLDGGPLSLRDAPTIGLAPGEALGSQPEPTHQRRSNPTFAPLDPPEGSLAPPEPDPEPTPSQDPDLGPSRGWLLLLVAAVVTLGLTVTLAGGGLLTWWASRAHRSVEVAPSVATAEQPAADEEGDTPVAAPDAMAATEDPLPTAPPAATKPDREPPTAPPTTGLVVVKGDASTVVLIDGRGLRHPPGHLPPGTYDLEASFASGATIRQPDRVTVRAGRTVNLRCVALMETCN
jgi:eukaryotic-like serine/threonine-protein kinase